MIYFTDVSFSNLFSYFWDKTFSINQIEPVSSYIKKFQFKNVITWNSQDFSKSFMKNINEHPWKRLASLKKMFDPIPIKVPLMSKYLASNRIFDLNIVSKFLDILKKYEIEDIRLYDPLNNHKNLLDILNICIKKDFNIEGSIFINTLNSHHSLPVKIIELYKENEINNINLYDPTGTLNIKTTSKIITELEERDKFGYQLSLSGKKESLLYIIENFLQSEINITGIDVTSFLNYPDPGPPNVISILSLFNELDLKSSINLKDLLKFQEELCLREDFSQSCNDFDNLTSYEVITKKIPSYIYLKILKVLKRNNKENLLKSVSNEVLKVQKDLDYPPLIPPFSDIIVSQAIFNVLENSKRYSTIIPELHCYLAGYYGINPNISKDLLKVKRYFPPPSPIVLPDQKNNPQYKNWELTEEERVAYEIASKEAEIYFLRKFSKIPDEIDLKDKKTLAIIVTNIVKHNESLQSIIINEENYSKNPNNLWGRVGRLDQMGTK